MKPAVRRWQVRETEPLPGFHPLLGAVLAFRGHTDESARDLLTGDAGLHSPWGLLGMRDAVDAIRATVSEGKPVAIYGDYDTDGVTACALLTRAFRRGGISVVHHIPNRVNDGYGLHLSALEALHAKGVGCVVTVDCGTANVEAAADRPQGLRLVITDHHLPRTNEAGEIELAPADAIVNPKQPGCDYAFEGLAGAGVAFKLVQALEEELILPPGAADAVVGLAALGTVADMMPLTGENRAIVRRGLGSLSHVAGLVALCEVSSAQSPVRASDVAFGLAPRINAAGRMDDALLALQLCLSDDATEAKQLAAQLDAKNRERQGAVAKAVEEAEALVAQLPEEDSAIVLGNAEWSPGIVGLIAGRIADRYARPTFVAALGEHEAKGSARTAPGIHLVKILDACAPTLLRYGGHTAAAGFSVEASRFGEFADAIRAATATMHPVSNPEKVFEIEGSIVCGELRPELLAELEKLEPCGMANPAPLLIVEGVQVLSATTFGANGAHLRMSVTDGSGICEAIAFFKGHAAPHLRRGRWIDLCGTLDSDEWQGQRRFRIHVKDVRPAQRLEVPGRRVKAPLPVQTA